MYCDTSLPLYIMRYTVSSTIVMRSHAIMRAGALRGSAACVINNFMRFRQIIMLS